jgi:hypothetical protein
VTHYQWDDSAQYLCKDVIQSCSTGEDTAYVQCLLGYGCEEEEMEDGVTQDQSGDVDEDEYDEDEDVEGDTPQCVLAKDSCLVILAQCLKETAPSLNCIMFIS